MPRPTARPKAAPDQPRLWDIFCHVVDNFGDVGVLWRLSAALAARGHQVRLWIDDASALAWMAPGALAGEWPGVRVMAWADAKQASVCSALPCADVWIEGFACEIPLGFVAHFADRIGANPGLAQPVWINLEYLSAQAYVERNHGLPSPVLSGPARGWTKYFFYPGFTVGSGGLIRNAMAVAPARHAHPAPASAKGVRHISLFCYEPEALPALLTSLGQDGRSSQLLVAHGRATQAVRRLLARDDFRLPGNLQVEYLPTLSQTEFDAMLGRCDLNLVRGEDSLVQAIWAGKPFIWQAYPQTDAAHRAKLDAVLDWLQADSAVRDLHRAWNGFCQPAELAHWTQTLADVDGRWASQVIDARQRLLMQDDLPTRLLKLVDENR
jgi:uncharacterized repeat protein (TIGR03837 family)